MPQKESKKAQFRAKMARMSEKRQAKTVILVRKGTEKARKVEIFEGFLFEGSTFRTLAGEAAPSERSGLARLRVNGKWFPARRKVLLTRKELHDILIKVIVGT